MPLSRQHLEPPELYASQKHGFSQVVVTPLGQLVFVSGQGAWDRDLNLNGGSDIAAQPIIGGDQS